MRRADVLRRLVDGTLLLVAVPLMLAAEVRGAASAREDVEAARRDAARASGEREERERRAIAERERDAAKEDRDMAISQWNTEKRDLRGKFAAETERADVAIEAWAAEAADLRAKLDAANLRAQAVGDTAQPVKESTWTNIDVGD